MDKKYWDSYYQSHGKDFGINVPSTFAKFCLNKFFKKKELKIIELGSGTNRDAIYFALNKLNIVAIDQSASFINIENQIAKKKIKEYLQLLSSDFVTFDYSKYKPVDVFYSRFTLHAITKKEEELLLPNIYNNLNFGGLFCVEARTTLDPLYGIGEKCGENTFMYNKHRRRFINTDMFREYVAKLGFKELYFIEKNNLSIYKNDNPVLMRAILEK